MKALTIILSMALTATAMAKTFTNQNTAFTCQTYSNGTTMCW